jgi:hypothetical protein
LQNSVPQKRTSIVNLCGVKRVFNIVYCSKLNPLSKHDSYENDGLGKNTEDIIKVGDKAEGGNEEKPEPIPMTDK